MVIGFTGTRKGMTGEQEDAVRKWLDGATEAHHGDCVGADERFHELARDAGVPVVLHPPADVRLRAFCEGAAKVFPERPFLDRNRDIVAAADLLLACPREAEEPDAGRGQGTWSTVRYARRMGARLVVIAGSA